MIRIAAAPTISVLAAVLAFSGCASGDSKPETAADRMRGFADAQSEEVERKNDLASKWEEGDDLTEEGRAKMESGREQVNQAEKNLREGREKIAEGERMIERGTEMKSAARQQFRLQNPGLDLQTSN